MAEFFEMGGYARFVWPAYGVAATVQVLLLVTAWRSARRNEAEVARLRADGVDPRRRTTSAGSVPAGEKGRA